MPYYSIFCKLVSCICIHLSYSSSLIKIKTMTLCDLLHWISLFDALNCFIAFWFCPSHNANGCQPKSSVESHALGNQKNRDCSAKRRSSLFLYSGSFSCWIVGRLSIVFEQRMWVGFENVDMRPKNQSCPIWLNILKTRFIDAFPVKTLSLFCPPFAWIARFYSINTRNKSIISKYGFLLNKILFT